MYLLTYLLWAEFNWVDVYLRLSQILVGPFLCVVLLVVDGIDYELYFSFFTNHMHLNSHLSKFFFVFQVKR